MKKKIEAQERTEPFIQASVLIVVQLAGFSKRLSTAISTVSLVLHPPPPKKKTIQYQALIKLVTV